MAAADSDFHALWMQDLEYPARLDRVFADNIFTAGVLGSSSFEVTPSSPAALTVDVTAGVAVVEGADQTAQGKYMVRKQTPETGLAIGAAPGSGQRNDLIVLEVRDPNATGPAGDDVRLLVVVGTPDVVPVDPTPPVTSLVLARVRVPSGTGSITSALIDDLRVQADFQHPTGTAGLQDGAVTTVKIADGAVTNAKLRDSAARTVIGRATSTTGAPADIAVNADQVVGRVGTGNVVSTQVQTNMIANGAVSSAKIGTNQVTNSEIASGTILAGNIGAGQVGTTQLADGAVTSEKIGTNQVTSSEIASSTIVNANIANNTITSAKINSGVPLGLRQVEVFTSSGTWSKPSWLRAALIRVQGAGGGGGGGGYSESFVTAGSLGSSESVTVGSGGSSGSSLGGNGGNGGFSRFGLSGIVRANGGLGGSGGSRTTSGNSILNDGGAGATTTGAVGQLQVRGGDGQYGICGLSSSLNAGGIGGSSALGGGGRPSSNSAGGDGGNGNVAGGGGAGGHTRSSPNQTGGVGARGVVIVEMYE